jgi:hypothetical protein
MGLDISYHSGVEKVPDSEVPENVKPYNDAYEKWERETEDSTLYHISEDTHFYNHLHPLETGWYKVYDVRDEDGYRGRTFRGGSYTGYNQWRNDLAESIGWLTGTQGAWESGEDYGPPFMELLNFSDSNGVIGSTVSKKLYNDFVDNEENVKKEVDSWYLKLHPTKEYDTSDMKWFNEKYDNFKEAFRVASNSKFGFVHFF